VKQIQDLKLDVLPHLPYSPHLVPSDFHLFWLLNDTVHGCQFRSDQNVKEAVYDWLAQQQKDFFFQGIYALVQCFPNFSAGRLLLALKNNQESSHPCSHKYRMSRWQVSKIKNLYLRTNFR
jgi:hypothetical protein